MNSFIVSLIVFTLCFVKISSNKPNILFIMADDLGWNDVSWHDPNMHTPNLERLAFTNGAILNQSYVNQRCSQTRSAFLSGHYAFHLGTQGGVFKYQEPSGVPIEFPFFPEELQHLEYKTYLVGKWHLGYCKKDYLPNYRGFDFFNGFLMGVQDYYTHSLEWPQPKQGINATGLDFWDQEEPEFGYNGTYSTELFGTQVENYLVTHNKSKPFFMFLSFQAPHNPLQVPEQYLQPCKQKKKNRRIYCGMVNALDVAVGRVVSTLKNLGLDQNTIIIFSTDNGGQTKGGGNNYPLRGNKNTLWEGGTRAISFVHSPKFIKKSGIRDNLFHVVDWYATILSMVGWKASRYGDGINQWRMIRGLKQKRKRKSLVYNINDEGAAIREGKYKIIIGKARTPSGWIPPAGPDRKWPSDEFDKNIMLFDLENETFDTTFTGGTIDGFTKKTPSGGTINDANWFEDPTERHDLASMATLKLISKLIDKVVKLTLEKVPSVNRPIDPRGDPKYFNGTFGSGFC